MKIKKSELRAMIRETVQHVLARMNEAIGGDGSERVDAQGWEHLEVGNTYIIDGVRSKFVGWFYEDGTEANIDESDPSRVYLKFEDEDDGFQWNSYWSESESSYVVGSSADPLVVQEVW